MQAILWTFLDELVSGSGGHCRLRHTEKTFHLQDGCSCVMDGQDVGDVVLSQ